MSGEVPPPLIRNVCHSRWDFPPDEEIPSQDVPPIVTRPGLGTPAQKSRSVRATILSVTSEAEYQKLPNSLPPLSLKQAGDLVGIFDDENDIPHQNHSLRPREPAQGSSTSRLTLANRTVISRIKEIIEKRDESGLTDYLHGEVAQTFIDDVYEALDPPHLPPRLRGKCLSALCRICGRLALLPKPLQIPVRYNRWCAPQYSGGYADVWKGECQGRPVAAKGLRAYSTSDFDKIRRRFCKEVITWNALNHPNVLPLQGVMMNGEQFVMVSEWMENGNINEFIKTHGDVNRIKLLKDVARGLAYMHDQGMVHGDLKGANILIDQEGHARLADFGFLTIVPDFTHTTTSNSFPLGGTIRWMSPELFYPDHTGLKDTRPTKQSDCYALGMVIYEVLSGQAPFTPFHSCIVIRKVIDGERPKRPKGAGGARFTNDLWRTLNLCWATEPQRRPSAVVVLECLERVSGDSGVSSRQVDENVEIDRDDPDITRDSPSESSSFSARFFGGFLCSILCLSRLQAIARKILASRRGGTDPGRPKPAAPSQDHS